MQYIQVWDQRRHYIILDTKDDAIKFAAQHWVHQAKRAIQQRGRFCVALSGGTTPKAIYQALALEPDVPWSKIYLFWGDERAVPPTHPDSNYKMAMEAAFQHLPIPPAQIIRMQGEAPLEQEAISYEELIRHHTSQNLFDLVMLGVGEDGHTASLFPNTEALVCDTRWVVCNFVPMLQAYRLTLTFKGIEHSRSLVMYALGSSKKEIVPKVLEAPINSPYPASRIGTTQTPALWILDAHAASLLPTPPTA
jgi:6-phosphogluconolactonase